MEIGQIGGRLLVNGIYGVTGMQYANTSRGGVEANNASFAGTSVVRRVVGVCAYEERGMEQGLATQT